MLEMCKIELNAIFLGKSTENIFKSIMNAVVEPHANSQNTVRNIGLIEVERKNPT